MKDSSFPEPTPWISAGTAPWRTVDYLEQRPKVQPVTVPWNNALKISLLSGGAPWSSADYMKQRPADASLLPWTVLWSSADYSEQRSKDHMITGQRSEAQLITRNSALKIS